jgi:imidazolonepropionase-like amidohydrolase
MRLAGLSLAQAVDMATIQPAGIIHCRHGGLESGDTADLVLFSLSTVQDRSSDPIKIQATVLKGECAYQAVD